MIVNGWLRQATRYPGPLSKGGYDTMKKCAKSGLVVHSMEGYIDVALAILESSAAKSWTFSNPKQGALLQHYEVEWISWASGSPGANKPFVSVETEGVAGEPLTENQLDNIVLLISELAVYCRFEPRRPVGEQDKAATLYEHNECTRFGSDATACPSGRYPWPEILNRLEGDDDMTEAQIKQLNETTVKAQHALNQIDLLKQWRHATNERVYDLAVRAQLSAQEISALKDADEDFDKRLDEAGAALDGD